MRKWIQWNKLATEKKNLNSKKKKSSSAQGELWIKVKQTKYKRGKSNYFNYLFLSVAHRNDTKVLLFSILKHSTKSHSSQLFIFFPSCITTLVLIHFLLMFIYQLTYTHTHVSNTLEQKIWNKTSRNSLFPTLFLFSIWHNSVVGRKNAILFSFCCTNLIYLWIICFCYVIWIIENPKQSG